MNSVMARFPDRAILTAPGSHGQETVTQLDGKGSIPNNVRDAAIHLDSGRSVPESMVDCEACLRRREFALSPGMCRSGPQIGVKFLVVAVWVGVIPEHFLPCPLADLPAQAGVLNKLSDLFDPLRGVACQ